MQIYKTIDDVKDEHKNCVLVIGNFDGVHKGHQQLIKDACKKAQELGFSVGMLTFEPHPRSLFRPNDPPFRITPEAVKNDRLAMTELDFVMQLEFNWDFASQSADTFINDILKNGLSPAHIFIGYDFRFGQMRKGGHEDLSKAGFELTVLDKIIDATGQKYSSSDIRKNLRHGKIDEANEQLGWDWYLQGNVFKGDQRGRELGYPTANISLIKTIHPAYGIYATWVQIEGEDTWRPAATNIGIRPMFEVPTGQVEAHLLDFDADLYDKTLRVKPVKLLRGEAKFDSLDDLIEQMDKDCAKARQILK